MTTPTQDLIERLNGTYRIPITDGLGPAGGEEPDNADFFVRTFPTSPLARAAALRLTELQDEVGRMRERNVKLEWHLHRIAILTDFFDPGSPPDVINQEARTALDQQGERG